MFFFSRFSKQIDPFRRWAREHSAQLTLDLETFRLTISRGGKVAVFYPRFSRFLNGRIVYTETFTDDAYPIGWLPYRLKRWRLASDKMAFKQAASEMGLRTPHCWETGTRLSANYIVKPMRGSFGLGISGPFGPLHSFPGTSNIDSALDGAHFYEQFIVGRSAKAWFWNHVPIALELIKPPTIYGDGVRSLGQIAEERRGNFDIKIPIASSKDILAWQGFNVDSVVPCGQEVMLDFRYATPFDRTKLEDQDVWESTSESVRQQFRHAGTILHEAIDEPVRRNTLFTLDAVVDADDQVWFLEMNSHPMIHPNAYPLILNDLLHHTDSVQNNAGLQTA